MIEIGKRFGSFQALDRAHLRADFGEVHALLGENGAGKSTLMNIAAGLYRPEAGQILIEGREMMLDGPLQARAAGIGMVHQHFKLVRSFTVVENVALGMAGKNPYSDQQDLCASIHAIAERLGFLIDPTATVGDLSVGEQQRVEIVKVLLGGARILILDEPTAVLTEQEATLLLDNVRRLAAAGAAVMLVTHKLREVERFCDRVTVMRRGRTLATIADPKRVPRDKMAELVVGAHVASPQRQPSATRGRTRLYVAGLSCRRADGFEVVREASFHVRDGEIYGLAGVSGNGQQELVETLMGLNRATAGAADLAGFGNIAERAGGDGQVPAIGFIPADRYALGLAAGLSAAENYGIRKVQAGAFGPWMWVNQAAMRQSAVKAIEEHDIQGVRSPSQPVALLSGGNAQKLILARELESAPVLIIAHNPSRGLDVRATASIQKRLLDAREAGGAVLLISEDLEEILTLSDRIGVISKGRIVAEFEPTFDRVRIGQAMVAHDAA
ncbi:MAG: ABC transporter ATP-binding protein [Hyphomicrobiaceae bacterium]|nr:ABC transporter ATP-binding protein [Hyphomicrobiaceae bacterium]